MINSCHQDVFQTFETKLNEFNPSIFVIGAVTFDLTNYQCQSNLVDSSIEDPVLLSVILVEGKIFECLEPFFIF